MKIYDPEQNQFEKEINFFYQKSDLLGWEFPTLVKLINDRYVTNLDEFNKLDEVQQKSIIKEHLLMLKHSREAFEKRNTRDL